MLARTILIATLIAVLSAFMPSAGTSAQNPVPARNIMVTVLSEPHGFDFGPYLNTLINRLHVTWPVVIPEASTRDKKGRVVLRFNIARDGKVADVRMVSGSGVEVLDKGARDTIANSNPFVRLPANFMGDQLALQVEFYYNVKA